MTHDLLKRCNRCASTYTIQLTTAELVELDKATPPPVFEARLGGQTLTYKELCPSCMTALGNYFDRLRETKKPRTSGS